LKADLVPADYQAEGLLTALKQAGIKAGQRVLIPRAAVARELLPEELRAMGVEVQVVPTYRTVRPTGNSDRLKNLLRTHALDMLTFTSSSTVRQFCEMFDSRDEARKLTTGLPVACIGPVTAQTATDEGLAVTITAGKNTIPALVEAIASYYAKP
jgi:uroporphyrinogen III methyltransferase/synthase